MDPILQSLLTSSPLALALGYAVKTLWTENQRLNKKCDECNERHTKEVSNLYREMIRAIRGDTLEDSDDEPGASSDS